MKHLGQPLVLEEAAELPGIKCGQHVATHAHSVLQHKRQVPAQLQVRPNKPGGEGEGGGRGREREGEEERERIGNS